MNKLSVVVSVNKAFLWKNLFDTLVQNSIDLELIFVGQWNDPEPDIPCIKIRTGVKASHCWEIGARAATGEFLCLTCDDCLYTSGFFDEAINHLSKPYDMVSAQYTMNNSHHIDYHRMFNQPNMPILPICGVVRTADHHAVGGIDNRFNFCVWDTDIYMRFWEKGGTTTMLNHHRCNEIMQYSSMSQKHAGEDCNTLRNFWYENGVFLNKRKVPIQSFNNGFV